MTGRDPLTAGIDLGTSGVRCVAVDAEGHLLSEVTRDYPLLTPKPGWAEQNPADWVQAVQAALAALAGEVGGNRFVAIGLSGQQHGMTPLDSQGAVVRPAILWNDQRTGDAVDEIHATVGRETMIQRSGNPAITGFQLPKIVWLRRHEPDNFARTERVLLPKDYIGYVLTGAQAAEPADGAGIGTMNIAARQWDDALLNALALPRRLFPELIESTAVVGRLTADKARATGLPEGIPVVAGGGDNQAAGTGLGLLSGTSSYGSVSLGTSGTLFVPTPHPRPHPEGTVHLFGHCDGGYHYLGATLSAAGSLKWFHDTFCPELSYGQLMAEAEQSPPGANGLLFLPHLAGERMPRNAPNLRGSWLGLSVATSRADMIRSLIEGVAYSLREVLELMRPLSELPETFLAIGGGAQSALWRRILCDILQVKLQVPESNLGAAYGAALIAQAGAEGRGLGEVVGRVAFPMGEVMVPGDEPAYRSGYAAFTEAPRSYAQG